MSTPDQDMPVAPAPQPLTHRELVVLEHLSDDATLREIATTLFVTHNTVKSQVRSLYRKLGVSTRADAVARARAARHADSDPTGHRLDTGQLIPNQATSPGSPEVTTPPAVVDGDAHLRELGRTLRDGVR